MKRALLPVALVIMASIGCQTHSQLANKDCQRCGPSMGQGQYAGRGMQNQADYVPKIPQHHYRQVEPAGPPTGTYAYPYYTTRAPRDFLLNNPSTIGY